MDSLQDLLFRRNVRQSQIVTHTDVSIEQIVNDESQENDQVQAEEKTFEQGDTLEDVEYDTRGSRREHRQINRRTDQSPDHRNEIEKNPWIGSRSLRVSKPTVDLEEIVSEQQKRNNLQR